MPRSHTQHLRYTADERGALLWVTPIASPCLVGTRCLRCVIFFHRWCSRCPGCLLPVALALAHRFWVQRQLRRRAAPDYALVPVRLYDFAIALGPLSTILHCRDPGLRFAHGVVIRTAILTHADLILECLYHERAFALPGPVAADHTYSTLRVYVRGFFAPASGVTFKHARIACTDKRAWISRSVASLIVVWFKNVRERLEHAAPGRFCTFCYARLDLVTTHLFFFFFTCSLVVGLTLAAVATCYDASDATSFVFL